MKFMLVALIIGLCAVSFIECHVLYRKYQRTVPPRNKSEKKVTEVVEIFRTYNRPPPFIQSEDELNLFLRNDAPPYRPQTPRTLYPQPYPQRPAQNPSQFPTSAPRTRPPVTPPPSLFGRRSTTIRPNPYENDNGFMNHYPEAGVTITKFVPVPNFTIREPPTTTAEPETTTTEEVAEEEVPEEVHSDYDFRMHEEDEEVTEKAVTESYYESETEEAVTEPEEEEITEEPTTEYNYEEPVSEPEPIEEEEITEDPTTEYDYYAGTEQPEALEEENTDEEPVTTTTEAVPEVSAEEEEEYNVATENPYDYGSDGDYNNEEEEENREYLTTTEEPQEQVEVTTKNSWFFG